MLRVYGIEPPGKRFAGMRGFTSRELKAIEQDFKASTDVGV